MGSSSLLSSLARRLEGKVAVITGGAAGIGECTAKLFANHGARIVIADIDDDKGHAVCNAIGHKNATYIHCDVTKESDVEKTVNTAISKHGKLDIMFANAGHIDPSTTSISATSTADFEKVLAVNVTGAFLAIKHATRVMVPARKGSVVVTASTASVLAGLTPHGYTCSKHAVLGLMKSAAAEVGRYGVRVNCVSPHGLPTSLAARAFGVEIEGVREFVEKNANLKGIGLEREDVAQALVYLASDEAKYVSGVNFLVDGGFSIVKYF